MRLATRLLSALTGSSTALDLSFIKNGHGWLQSHLPRRFEVGGIDISRVRARADQTARLGEKPLWAGYRDVADYPRDTGGSRTSAEVRTDEDMGIFFAWLAIQRRPEIIVEFGTAFGISGMFWLTGLEHNDSGTLMTYEPNEIWAAIAADNLRAISDRFRLTNGIFEDHAASTLSPKSVDIAFIDAIHTSAFVNAQFAILRPYLKDRALVVFDDINFSDDMQQCWTAIAASPDVTASVRIGNRVGLVELA